VRDGYLDRLPPRVQARIRVDDEGGCDLWAGGMSGRTNGGGVGTVDGVYGFVHRAVWRSAHGPIRADVIIVRVCRNRRCVRLEHLQATTPSRWLRHLLRGEPLT